METAAAVPTTQIEEVVEITEVGVQPLHMNSNAC
jgi:hypothetical protein